MSEEENNDAVDSTVDSIAGGDETPAEPETKDWRSELAGDDDKFAEKLKRYSTAADFAKAHKEAEQRIREGFKQPELVKDATEEQVAEYRKQIGVPETAEDYAINLPEGLTIGEADKPLWDMFLAEGNKTNLTQAELDKVAPAYYAMEAALREQQDNAVKDAIKENEAALKVDWGSDFDSNLNINENFLTKEGGDVLKEKLTLGYTADGTPLASDPDVAKFLNNIARSAGFSDNMAYDNAGGADGVQDSIKEIMGKRTGDGRDAYYKDKAQVAKDDARLQELYAMKERFNQ